MKKNQQIELEKTKSPVNQETTQPDFNNWNETKQTVEKKTKRQKQPKIRISITLEQQDLEYLQEYSDVMGLNVSAVIRMWIREKKMQQTYAHDRNFQ